MHIPITKVSLDEREIDSVVDVLRTGILAQGEKVKEFETAFAKYCGVKHAIAVNNGTAALHTALYAAGVREGDEVITTPFTFVATANAIVMCGAKPVFVDIDHETYTINPVQIENAITKKTKAIIPVDLYGHLADYDAIAPIAKKHNLKIICDSAQAVGAEYKGKRAGAFGDATSFSLYATKNLMCGEGGVVTTDDDEIASMARRFRNHGQGEQYEYIHMGYNYRMTNIAATIALGELEKIEEYTEKRRDNASLYSKRLAKISDLVVPVQEEGYRHVFHQYTLRSPKRDNLLNHLNENGVGARVYYPKPLHLHKHFAFLGYKHGDFPESERASAEVLSLPVHPLLADEEKEYVLKLFGDAQ